MSVDGVSAGPEMRHRETEVKIRISEIRALRACLKQLGFVAIHARALEDNILFDTPDRKLRAVRSILRLRRYKREWLLTYKGTPEADPHYKSRLELESHLDTPDSMQAILAVLGLIPVFRYQKYRTLYALVRRDGRRAGGVEVALDETPIGNFIEVEGTRRAIDRVARELGFSKKHYSTASYGALYLEDCARKKMAPADMLFPLLDRPVLSKSMLSKSVPSKSAGLRRTPRRPPKAGAGRRAGY